MNQQIRIRKYDPRDARALADLFYHTIHRINAQHYSAAQLEAWAPASCLVLEGWQKKWSNCPPIVAVCGDQVVGFAEFEPNGHIDCFYVHHKYQGCGVGTVLMQEIHTQARASGLARIYAEVSISAKPFFSKKGFRVVQQQTVTRRGVDLINFVMDKTLKNAANP